jgi:putative SOS response-associated peptidase YedK
MTAIKTRFGIHNQINLPKDEVLPGSWYPILRDALSGTAELFQWGLSDAKMGQNDRLVYAIKVEELMTKAGRGFLTKRVLVPVNSFLIRNNSQTFAVKSKMSGPFAVAAVWDIAGQWRGRPTHAFRIITGPTVEGYEELGPRWPIVLRPENERDWLWHFTDEDQALDALEPDLNLEFEVV